MLINVRLKVGVTVEIEGKPDRDSLVESVEVALVEAIEQLDLDGSCLSKEDEELDWTVSDITVEA